jgi:hypothetical protein
MHVLQRLLEEAGCCGHFELRGGCVSSGFGLGLGLVWGVEVKRLMTETRFLERGREEDGVRTVCVD